MNYKYWKKIEFHEFITIINRQINKYRRVRDKKLVTAN